MTDQQRLLAAIVLSIVILLGFEFLLGPRLVEKPQPQPQTAEQPAEREAQPEAPAGAIPAVPESGAEAPGAPQTRATVLAKTPRVEIETPRLKGSISLKGAVIDDLTLRDYRVSTDPKSALVTLLSPLGADRPYFAQFGWIAAHGTASLPGPNTVWQADRRTLSPGNPVTLTWENGNGLRFERVYEIDEDYMFTVTQRVTNSTDAAVTLYPYGLVSRTGTPKTWGFYILHEGPLGVFDNTLKEVDYDDLRDEGTIARQSTGGWIGITDKYWLVALIPRQSERIESRFLYARTENDDKYQVDYRGTSMTVAPGASAEDTNRMFTGAKEVNLLDGYRDTLHVPLFDRAVDFGWFYFLTKPIFYVLDYFNGILGNFGLAILLLTVIIKALFFPLANKSYRSMSRMRKLQPEMLRLRDRYKDDKVRLNQEMMALYKREKVNPASGCLPVIIQIPVFFALYKVLFVTIEMRHAPFYGWIQDLSARDPTTLFNLFGLIPWTPPDILMIGAWPLIMGLSMFLQQKLNPQPADPMQAKLFMFLPVVFTFLLARFPAGLVIYWAWNNVLSIAQQWVIMRREGVR